MRVIKVGKIFTPEGVLEGHFILENRGIIEGILPLADLSWAEALAEETLEFPPDSVALPGFFDHHTHTLQRGISLVYPNLSSARSLAEAGEMIRSALDFPERPIIFTEYDDSGWENLPDRRWLDSVAGEIPVIMRRICGHKAVANSAACRLLPDPSLSDENGVLLEEAALHLFGIFRPSPETMKRSALAAQEECMRLGITGVREIGSARVFRTWQEIEREGLLRIGIEFYFTHASLEHLAELGLGTGFGGRIRIGGIKAFLDGSIGARTARFRSPYKDTGGRGIITISAEELLSLLSKAQEAGIRVLLHAIGDEAIGLAISAYRKVLTSGNPLGHTIEHAEAITKEQTRLAGEMGLVLSVQPNFLQWQTPGGLYEKALGRRRARALNPFRDIIESGSEVVFGSDSMPPGPQYGISLAANRPDPDEAIAPEHAIALYTETEVSPGQPLALAITDGIPGQKVYATFTPTGYELGRLGGSRSLDPPDAKRL
jgi:predicted amidohydrolase YtcJ